MNTADQIYAHSLGVAFDGFVPTACSAYNCAQNCPVRLHDAEKHSRNIAGEMGSTAHYRHKSHARGMVIVYLFLALLILVPFAYMAGRMAR